MSPKTTCKLRPLLLGAVAVSLLFLPTAAVGGKDPASEKGTAESSEKATEKPTSDARQSKRPLSAKVEVYTNEDLERLFAGETPETDEAEPSGEVPAQAATPAQPGSPPQPGEAAPSITDPAAWLAARKAKAEERQRLIAEAQAKVDGLRARIADLEKRNLAARNPYLLRPEVPEEDRKEWDGANGEQRVAATERQLADARRELRLAERELADARSAR